MLYHNMFQRQQTIFISSITRYESGQPASWEAKSRFSMYVVNFVFNGRVYHHVEHDMSDYVAD